jgi:3-oxoacyl-[acyl-carrier-protein] synthase III
MYQSKIAGLGSYVPENVVTNDDLSKIMDTNDAWIQERTGIKERRHIKKGDGNSTAIMGVKAAKIALERAKIDKDEIDLIIFATLSPDYYFPGCGVQVQEMLDIHTCPALDVRNQCSGFVYALSVGDQFIKTGMYTNILVIGSENHSGGLDFTTRGRSVSVIFGDGAGAAVLTRSDHNGQGVLSTHLHSEGKHALELSLKGPSTMHWVPEIIEENPQGDDIPLLSIYEWPVCI